MLTAIALLIAASALDPSAFRLIGTRAEVVTYQGRTAMHLSAESSMASDGQMLAISPGEPFRDGEIEIEVAGTPRNGAPVDSRGFIGVAFRVQPDGSRFECFYLRPTNGRAEDQLRRNHSTQYVSHPDFPWEKLRQSSPGLYESYADMVPGEWTKIRIVVKGRAARLYVNGADQPSLIVSDLKLGETSGAIALWAHVSTDAYFTMPRVIRK